MGATNYSVFQPTGYQAISAASSAASTLTIPSVGAQSAHATQSNYAFIVAETTAVRWRDDGTAPTATVGTPLAAATGFEYDGPLNALQFISQGAQAIVHVNYYRAN